MQSTRMTAVSICMGVALTCVLACCSGPLKIHVSDEYHGQIEVVSSKYDTTIPDTMARVIIDCFLAHDHHQRWFSFVSLKPEYDGKEKNIRTSTVRSDTLYVPATMYRVAVRYRQDACFSVVSRPVPLYHQHEYKIRCFLYVPHT